MAEFRPEMCTEAAQQGLMQWLLKRLKVSLFSCCRLEDITIKWTGHGSGSWCAWDSVWHSIKGPRWFIIGSFCLYRYLSGSNVCQYSELKTRLKLGSKSLFTHYERAKLKELALCVRSSTQRGASL